MGKSTGSPLSRKHVRPEKPYPEFPLSPHASGKWMKKVNRRIHYFGRWGQVVRGSMQRLPGDGWKEALEDYKLRADDLHAGRAPRSTSTKAGLTVANLCNDFLTSKLRKQEAGELTPRMFGEYKAMTDMVIGAFEAGRLVDDLAAADFAALRDTMTKRWGPLRVLNGVVRVKTIFKYGFDSGLIDRPVRYGPEFVPPSRSVLRRHKAKSPPKMIEAAHLRQMIDAADVPLRAMILLALNCGYGNGDCASLPIAAVDLDAGWIDFARPKTGIPRRCPLWAETIEALRAAIEASPMPASDEDAGLVFLTYRGTPWVRMGEKSRTDYVSIHFNALLKKLKANRTRCSFYSLRHVFRTVADAARDQVAARAIMGHVDAGIDATYRERIDDSRLKAVVDHVRQWLYPVH